MKNVITTAMLLSATVLTAQENKTAPENNVAEKNHPVTMRIKKVEIINGVEKTTDTTFTVNGPLALDAIGKFSNEKTVIETDTKMQKIVVITNEVHGDSIRIVESGEVMDEQVVRSMKLAADDGKSIEDFMTVNLVTPEEGAAGKVTKIVILKTTKIVDPNELDAKMLSKETGVTEGKLLLDKINFYPNPTNGKFNLSFSLAGKGGTEITILNSEGKKVYTEKVSNFSGSYDKEIDISQNPKGAYFVRIAQGGYAQVKKVVLE